MANLKEIKQRISSVKSTRQITSAMKMVSAAKLRKAQNAITQMRPYATKLNQILEHLSTSANANENVYAQTRTPNKVLLVGITSNRGLCGAFNTNVGKQIMELLKGEYKTQHQAGQVHIWAIGKKANDYLKSKKLPTAQNFSDLHDEFSFEAVANIAQDIMNRFIAKEYDKVVIVYNQFKNAAVQILTTEQMLPILPPEGHEHLATDYIFEPDEQYIVNKLIPDSIKVQLFKALLDSHAAEHGARMTAMHKATDNATDLIKELTLSYNKARQSAITSEIIDIVGGAEALKNS